MSNDTAIRPRQPQTECFAQSALRTIDLEQTAIADLVAPIDDAFKHTCQLMFDCSARVVLLGMGKSGHIANKIVATLASTTAEIVTLLPMLKRLGVPLIVMTGAPESTLAKAADQHLNVQVNTEACPLNLAPTSSTTASLVMGDAIAIALLEARGFSANDFAFSHPGGALGRKLLLKVSDIIQAQDNWQLAFQPYLDTELRTSI